MTKFCTKCGKKLEKGQKCDCEIIKRKDTVYNENKNVSSLFEHIKEFVKKPVDKLKKSDIDQNSALLIILITSLSFGLLSDIFRLIGINRSIFAIFSAFIYLLILPTIITLIEKLIYNKEKTFNKNLNIVSLCSVILLCTNIIAFLTSMISISLTLFILLIGIITFINLLYHGLYIKKEIDSNKIVYLTSLSITISIIVYYLVMIIIY